MPFGYVLENDYWVLVVIRHGGFPSVYGEVYIEMIFGAYSNCSQASRSGFDTSYEYVSCFTISTSGRGGTFTKAHSYSGTDRAWYVDAVYRTNVRFWSLSHMRCRAIIMGRSISK